MASKTQRSPKKTKKSSRSKKSTSTGLKRIQEKLDEENGFKIKPGNPRVYRMKEKYEPGDKIQHSRFGEGVVEREVSNSKIEVSFDEGLKVLIHDVPPLAEL